RIMDRLAQQMKRRGPSLSSRVADRIAAAVSAGPGGEPSPYRAPPDSGSADRVAEELCRLEGGSRALLYCSGMTAINRTLDVLRRPGRSQVIAIGHLYNDTFQGLVESQGPDEQNLFLGVDEIDTLDARIGARTAAILTETITNPLSDVPDLIELSRIANAHGVPLVVDNTLATPVNCRPLTLGADYVVHSTTKYLNGRNDHGGGAVIVKDPRLVAELERRQSALDDRMSALEAGALEGNLRSVPQRMDRYHANAARVSALLAEHPAVGRLYFNGHPSHRCYQTARRLLNGPGSVISFTLARADVEAFRAFYDSPLAGILKAPSLGSDLTLLCPYTLLTHSKETDEQLHAIGLPRYLARIAVGCEQDIAPVLESLDAALRRSLMVPEIPA
ncbi:MAG TPA: PLP-dependent transferase, partial [Spirochaetia bacterium]|nr:PLP-dependent transferase [Spirochaetia bacterium]